MFQLNLPVTGDALRSFTSQSSPGEAEQVLGDVHCTSSHTFISVSCMTMIVMGFPMQCLGSKMCVHVVL